MRRLIHIPIIHTTADLGSLSDTVRARYARVWGDAKWSEHERSVRELWIGIERDLDRLRLDARTLRIYQDGLPVCGFEDRIVRELAQAGSANHQLILKFLDLGAMLMGTEDPQLLMEEYELHKRERPPAGGKAAPQQPELRTVAQRLLKARDAFIAQRIDATLQEEETGLLFLGALHRLDSLQSKGVRTETLGDASHETVRRPRS
jgi:hypothetical protein